MRRLRIPAAALVVTLVVALATPSFADSAEQRRAANRAKRAEAAAKLNTLKAEDAQLEAALRDLDSHVATQSATAQSAQQAASVADAAVGSAEGRLAATEQRMAGLRAQAAALAIRAYVHPGGDTLLEILGSHDLAEASRRETLLSHVASTDQSILGELRATREDQQAEQSDLARLRDQADARRKAAAARLAELKSARNDQTRLKAALDTRIQEFTTEVDALAREQANIENLIRSRQAAGGSAQPASGGGGSSSKGASKAGLIWPVSGPITSGFGPRWGRMHTGIDISAGTGTPIKAAKGGTVISAGSNGGYGLAVIIDHGGGLSTLYGHMSSIAVSGGSVSQGEVIGRVGCTGHCTGPHLHFETRVGGSPQNPMAYL
ncbi:MAG TPA: peptidoglycan DD-metalloendopeptidase family protein [Acidimicrobiales bacterium]|jgi:murein DD-endopeptidase MepM/ murein hydrolase activator NlpD|nr:peptidoglycan DD-metalloendopeptidase family protein [Acidimicrobiales bacterium]